MLLTDTIRKSTAAIERQRSMREDKEAADNYAKALKQLSQVINTLQSTVDCVIQMQSSGIVMHPILTQKTRDELNELINNCGMSIYEYNLTTDLVTAFKTKVEAFSSEVTITWKNTALHYSEGPKGYLSMIGGLTDNPSYAQNLAIEIDKAVNNSPSSTTIRKLVSAVGEANKITDSFAISPDIESFLKKVASQHATVSDLSPDIIRWLEKKKLKDKLRVKFK